MAIKKLSKKAAPAKKAATRKTAVKAKGKAPAKKKAKAVPKAKVKSKRKPNAAFMAPLKPSEALAEIVGGKPLPRTEVVKRIWAYIKKNGLQDRKNKREINADAKLKAVVRKDKITMFELAKLTSKHLS